MSAPLYEKLVQYSKSGVYPFHMPGHKRAAELDPIFALDITEIDGFDNLHQAQGVIAQAQDLAAKAFGADYTFFLVNGASCGLQAALLACGAGKKMIIARNCHKSVYDGLILSGGSPFYLMPRNHSDFPVFGGINPADVERVCRENRDAAAVIVVSPTYEGIVSDIKAISEIVHRYGMILIVDEAHGAHFNFSDFFPESAVKCGADIVVQSAHKTLPAPTQTAFLHVVGERVNLPRLTQCLSMTQSSSPSYLLMGLLDRCRDYMENNGREKMVLYERQLELFRRELKKLKNFSLLTLEELDGFDYDRGKIVLFCHCMNCVELGHILRTEKKIELEMTTPSHLLAMTSLMDQKEGFDRLLKGLTYLDSLLDKGTASRVNQPGKFIFPEPKVDQKPSKAIAGQSEFLPLRQSAGRISAGFIIPYPPGIPLIVPGERITVKIIETVLYYKDCNINLIGINGMNVEKILVLK